MAPVVVEIRDQNDRPLEGADVIFRFPPTGPGAIFPDGKFTRKARSNGQGQAAAVGWTANNEVGEFKVYITATYGNQLGEAAISMSNVSHTNEVDRRNKAEKKWWSSRWVKIGLLAGGAGVAAAIVLATRGGSPPTITIRGGSPTIGGPR
jgi:hypothetical protein